MTSPSIVRRTYTQYTLSTVPVPYIYYNLSRVQGPHVIHDANQTVVFELLCLPAVGIRTKSKTKPALSWWESHPHHHHCHLHHRHHHHSCHCLLTDGLTGPSAARTVLSYDWCAKSHFLLNHHPIMMAYILNVLDWIWSTHPPNLIRCSHIRPRVLIRCST